MWLSAAPGGVAIRLKVVPGASRDAVAGALGDRLKVRVAAPPEGGRANRAIEKLLGELTGCTCTVVSGHGSPLKTLLVADGRVEAVRTALAG